MEFILTPKVQEARSRLCLPLDGLDTLDEVRARVHELRDLVGIFKIGKELFTRFGPAVVEVVTQDSGEVFLDLKYHDIPNTVKGAAMAATGLGVRMFNVHASGGVQMMRAAIEGAELAATKTGKARPKIIAVTVLTSIDAPTLVEEMRVPGGVDAHVLHLAKLALQAGLDGVVCSAADLQAIRTHLPPTFMYVTPGIKGVGSTIGADQKRVFTPGNAIASGATILVAGRTITDHATSELRRKAAYEILQDMAKSL